MPWGSIGLFFVHSHQEDIWVVFITFEHLWIVLLWTFRFKYLLVHMFSFFLGRHLAMVLLDCMFKLLSFHIFKSKITSLSVYIRTIGKMWPGTVSHTCNLAIRETEIGRITGQGQPAQKVHEIPSQAMAGCSVCTWNPSYAGKAKYDNCNPGRPRHKGKPYLKTTNTKMVGRVPQVVVHLLSKDEALSPAKQTNCQNAFKDGYSDAQTHQQCRRLPVSAHCFSYLAWVFFYSILLNM
jgi:hypothetical protein